ncbi:hypothetical protein [Geobacter grbiciae]|uniref:hypothetical protein n=1 Tax=Geobacter grbiciae TaxID=155042 RepID=UPI001C01102B|nr:hypothetical protein [Geobacter grbiciae]MBT1073957.1 hypothetical protein [Geobacter grbiciae]
MSENNDDRSSKPSSSAGGEGHPAPDHPKPQLLAVPGRDTSNGSAPRNGAVAEHLYTYGHCFGDGLTIRILAYLRDVRQEN